MTRRGRRRLGLLLAAVAAASATGCAATTDVQEAAATRSPTASTWFLESGGVVPPTATAPPTAIGLSPVIPRPHRPEFVPPVVPHGVGIGDDPPPATCGGYGTPTRINPGVVPGAGSATLSWQADGRPEVTGYRVQAVPQTLVTGAQPEPRKQTAAQPAGCAQVTVTMAGLTRGEVYVFWLEEAVVDSITGVTRLVQVGSSAPVTVP
jgi:hypothetical protein